MKALLKQKILAPSRHKESSDSIGKMAGEIKLSDSPVFDIEDDNENDFTLNLSDQLAIIDNDVMMDDVEIIENSDDELDSTLDVTNTTSMILTFPMLSLLDKQGDIPETEDNVSITQVTFQSESAQETRMDVKRKGRTPKAVKQPSFNQCERTKRSGSRRSKQTVRARIKEEGLKCKLNSTWYQINLRDIRVIEALETAMQVIMIKLKKRHNIRHLSLDLHQVELAISALEDDRLEIRGMTQEAWDELFHMTKNNLGDVQVKLGTLRENVMAETGPSRSIDRKERLEDYAKSPKEKGPASAKKQNVPASPQHSQSIAKPSERNKGKTTRVKKNNDIQVIESDSTALPDLNNSACAVMENGRSSPEINLWGSQDDLHQEEVAPTASTSLSNKQNKNKNHKQNSVKISQRENSAKIENEADKKRSSIYKTLLRASFNFKSLLTRKILLPGKSLKMLFNDEMYTALLQQGGNVKSQTNETFPSLAKWVTSIFGKLYSKLLLKERLAIRIYYSDVPLEEVLDGVQLIEDTVPLNETCISLEDSQSSIIIEIPQKEHKTPSNGTLSLVPDEMTRHIKQVIMHTEAEYFPTCNCYEKCWAGKGPFPQHYLDELDKW